MNETSATDIERIVSGGQTGVDRAALDAALALGGGDLDRRVAPAGPHEIADVGVAFNFLAERLRLLLAGERESVADLSHRLRTPLTALRATHPALWYDPLS